jgi:hypothetical protein
MADQQKATSLPLYGNADTRTPTPATSVASSSCKVAVKSRRGLAGGGSAS